MPESGGAQRPDETAASDLTAADGGAANAGGGAAPPRSVDDADDLRGYHFKRLIGKGSTWALIVGAAVVLGAALAIATSPGAGGLAFVAVVLIGVGITFVVADRRAADAFFALYAERHGLELGGKQRLPESTPLLKRGDRRYAERTLAGDLSPGCEGILALYTYEEEHTDSDGNRDTDYYRYTVGLVPVPDCSRFVPELFCQRRFGFRALEGFEDVFRRSKERVKLESEVLDDKYEIFAGKGQDANWLRQLFEPTFIVWLTDSAPEKFGFELVDGNLCCYVSGHKEDAADLDTLSVATATVATRLREEAGEEEMGDAATVRKERADAAAAAEAAAAQKAAEEAAAARAAEDGEEESEAS